MTGFPTFEGLHAAMLFAVGLGCLLLFSGVALLAGIIWRHKVAAAHRGPTIVLRSALFSSLFLFAVTALMFVFLIVTNSYRGPHDFFSVAFWPATSGLIAFIALDQIKRCRPKGLR